MIDQTARTNHVTQFLWTTWEAGRGTPDLTPASLEGSLLLSMADATERAAGEIIGAAIRKAEKSGEAYEGPETLEYMYEEAFHNLNKMAMADLKKVFDTVMKHYYTVVFKDPSGQYPDFVAYATPTMYYELENLARQQRLRAPTTTLGQTPVSVELPKRDACVKKGGIFICSQPVSCRTCCKYWHEPEEGNRYQCYYQDRNAAQESIEDGLICQCLEAIQEADPNYRPDVGANG